MKPVLKSNTACIAGFFIIGIMILTAIFPETFAPYSPFLQTGRTFEKPGAEHILGTNDIGQDIFSELIYSTRNSLAVGALSAVIALSIGVFTGVAAGWYGGVMAGIIMQITAFFLAIPFLPTVIILSAFMRGGVWSMSLILGFMSWPAITRVLYAAVLEIKTSAYIKVIRGMGAGGIYIIVHHVIRELFPLILYRGIMRVKSGILAESSMSFLGLGNPAEKSWGAMIYYAQAKNAVLTGTWVWWIIPPGVCICLVSIALMMIAYRLEAVNDKRIEVRP
jgi:ABC-type dipeptide/oligopeptide/nickel transport system permease subunit